MQLVVTTPDVLEGLIHKAIQAALQNQLTVKDSPEQKEIISTEELCKRLDITEPTCIRWRKKGKIPFLSIGSSIRYEWNTVVKALENKIAR